MYCSNCGKENANTATFCSDCGNQLSTQILVEEERSYTLSEKELRLSKMSVFFF